MGVALTALAVAACSLPGVAPEGRDLTITTRVPAAPAEVAARASRWLGAEGYATAGGSLAIEARRALPGPGTGRIRLSLSAAGQETEVVVRAETLDADGDRADLLDARTRSDAVGLVDHLGCAGGAPWPACP